MRAFAKWSRKIRIWQAQISSYMRANDAALLLYNSLTGELEAELEHAPLTSINHKDGIEFILTQLEGPIQQKVIFQKRKCLSDFENVSRYPREALRTYANRYRRIGRNLDSLGVIMQRLMRRL